MFLFRVDSVLMAVYVDRNSAAPRTEIQHTNPGEVKLVSLDVARRLLL